MPTCLSQFQGSWLSSESQLLQTGETSDNPALVLLVREQSPCKEVACPSQCVCQDHCFRTLKASLAGGPRVPKCSGTDLPLGCLPYPLDRHFLASQMGKTQEQREIV